MEDINRSIDALSQTRNHKELVTALQRILGQMSYFISQSEGVVLDHRELWHDAYAAALNSDADSVPPPPSDRGADPPRHGSSRPPRRSAKTRKAKV